jgi:ribonuclease Z
MAELFILGSGEAFDPARPNTSLLYQGEQTILIDCGFAAVQALWRHSTDVDYLDAVLLTHHHADHTFGLPALLMVLEGARGGDPRRRRSRPLTLIGPPGTRQYITDLFDLAYAPGLKRLSYPVAFMECAPGQATRVGRMTIRTALPDHGIPVLSTRWEAGGRARFAYSADGKATEATRALYRGAPVLVHECYALAGSEGPVHSNVEKVLEAAAESGAGTLVLVHQAVEQRAAIADYLKTQTIFSGVVLAPDEPLVLTV